MTALDLRDPERAVPFLRGRPDPMLPAVPLRADRTTQGGGFRPGRGAAGAAGLAQQAGDARAAWAANGPRLDGREFAAANHAPVAADHAAIGAFSTTNFSRPIGAPRTPAPDQLGRSVIHGDGHDQVDVQKLCRRRCSASRSVV